MPTGTTTRVVVRLPYNRPEQPLEDPPQIEWNAEKANILWEVIARSRASESGGTDWKGLAAHLQVPLPYLLYRAQTRYEEDLRGLQDIRGVLSPPNAQGTPPKSGDDLVLPGEKPTLKISTRTASTGAPLSASTRQTTPLAVRARLNSLGNSSRSQKVTSSSTITLQGPRKPYAPLRRTSPSPSSSSNSEDEAAAKEEENERLVEEQDALAKKLSVLQKMMTSDALGLVSPSTSSTPRRREMERGRFRLASSMSIPMSRHRDDHHSSRSQSVSSTSSPQNSIPSVPSPSDSQRNSPISRHLSHSKSSSPPAVSPRSARGRSHLRYGPLISPAAAASEQGSEVGSTHGTSSASSFSDLSEASLSASAVESALMTDTRPVTSRFSQFTRSRFGSRGRGVHL